MTASVPPLLPEPDANDPFAVLGNPLAKSVAEHAQHEPVRGWRGRTLRDEANALALYVFRNTFVEDLHAGGRISDHEMKRLNIQSSAKLAHILYLRDWLRTKRPKNWYALLEAEFLPWVELRGRAWERAALDWEVPSEDYVACVCGRDLPRGMWKFCPWCGRSKTS